MMRNEPSGLKVIDTGVLPILIMKSQAWRISDLLWVAFLLAMSLPQSASELPWCSFAFWCLGGTLPEQMHYFSIHAAIILLRLLHEPILQLNGNS